MKFVAYERAKQGTGASRRLRNSGRTPGIVYGAGQAPTLIELDHNNLWHALKKEAFHSSILDMELAGNVNKVLLRDVQYHPFKQLVLHVDFQRINAAEKIHMRVPVHYVGEAESPAVKFDKCLLNYIVSELEIVCLPADLPEFIEVDVSKLEKGDTLTLSNISIPAGVEVAGQHGHEETVFVSVVTPAEESAAEEAPEGGAAATGAPAPAADAGEKK